MHRQEPAAALAWRYGISENTLYHHWRDEFLAAGETALTHVKNKADARNWRIAELKKELAEWEKTSYAMCLKPIAGTDNRPHNFSKSQSDCFFNNGHFEIKYRAATASTTKLNT